ncbi:MAG: hypothetical protein A2020_14400 [Lentisphaerae bacterium GWF2_45_14]|nr:MAG: hypothetical protein A2020_14400 [Lentisphaerae bacterium GWF2_45_14]
MSKIIKKGKVVSITPEKDIVAGEVQNFRQELLSLINEKFEKIEVDIDKVEMIDSSGIGVFIATQNSLKKINGTLTVINVSADILKMFKIMRLDKHFEVEGKN